jgi:tetratricopeptide (TPR) repeat protein
MEKIGPEPRRLPAVVVPCVAAVVLFAIYLATLNQWVGVRSIGVVAGLGRWTGAEPAFKPGLEILALPLRVLPAAIFPKACNLLSALCGALAAALAARVVALLPYDRSRAGRLRGHDADPWLHVPLAWAPPVLAAGLSGLALTAWENATSLTGETPELLLFAACAACLCQYRLKLRDFWLWAFAFLTGAGMASNFAMIAFGPLFLVALVWIRGVSFANTKFLARLAFWFALGLLVHVVGAWLAAGDGYSFGSILKTQLIVEKDMLLGTPRGRILLFALLTLLPFAFIGVRWGNETGSSLEQRLTVGGLVLVEIGWTVANIVMAFDPPFSPRNLVYLDPTGGGVALLTFSFCGAVVSAYVAGHLILLGSVTPAIAWARPSVVGGAVLKASMAVAVVACAAAPAALMWKNWPLVANENAPWLDRFAKAVTDVVPAKSPAILMADDPIAALTIWASCRDHGVLSNKLVVNAASLARHNANYRAHVVRESGGSWPSLAEFAKAESGVIDKFLPVWNAAAESGQAFYVNPSINFLVQQSYQSPVGPLFQMRPFAPGKISPPPPTDEEAARIKSYWTSASPALKEVAQAAEAGSVTADWAASFWSRAANVDGVILQAARRFDGAAELFRIAVATQTNNASARVNLEVNAALKAGKPVSTNLSRFLPEASPAAILNAFGFVDEPDSWLVLGRLCLTTEPPLLRSAAAMFARARDLAPDRSAAWLGYLAVCNSAAEYGMVLDAAADFRARGPLKPTELVAVTRHEANARFHRGELEALARTVADARAQLPADTELLLLETDMYRAQKQPENALKSIDEWLRVAPNDPKAWLRRARVLMEQKQFAEAEAALNRGRAKNGQDADLHQVAVDLYMETKRLDLAIRAAEDWQASAPTDSLPRIKRGEIFMLQKQFSDAVKVFDRVLESFPDSESAQANRAISLLELNRLAEARTDYQRLASRRPGNWIYQYGLGEIARRENNRVDALQHFESYLKSAPKGTEEYRTVESFVRQLKGP